MSIDAMKQALDFLEWFAGDDHSIRPKHKAPEIAAALRQAIAEAEKQEPVAFRNIETGEFCTGGFLRKDWAKWQPLYASPVHASDISQEPVDETPPCKTHPDAPHGFDRNASHSEDRYVCECEGWEPPKREWVGLESDEQILEISKDAWGKDKLNRGRDDHRSFYIAFAQAIEAKLKEKNA